jgi:uncharacterized membrane protein (UPF0127 family)
MRFWRAAAALAAALAVAACSSEQPATSAEPAENQLVIATDGGDHTFTIEIADTVEERARGLMYRRELADDAGMLFDFKEEERASFWMRNTYIPLDMLFIEEDGTIESIAERTIPFSEKSVLSKGPVRYVLEINGGRSDALGIEAGDVVSGPAIEPAE